MKTNKTSAFTLVELLVVIAIIGMLVGLLLPAVQQVRAAARRMQCLNNLKQLGLAVNNYESTNGGFPIGMYTFDGDNVNAMGRGGDHWRNDHNWYSQMGPYIEQQAWYDMIDFDVSMSMPVNLEARKTKISMFACPADIGLQENEWNSTTWARVRSNYCINFGNTTYGQRTKEGVEFRGAPVRPRQKTPISRIPDGLSNTLLFSEVCVIPTTTGWGGSISDVSISLGCALTGWNPPNSKVSDETYQGVVNNADYTSMGIPKPVSAAEVNQVITARSHHSGGVNHVLCDGSGDFTSDLIDSAVWRALSSAKGGKKEAQEKK